MSAHHSPAELVTRTTGHAGGATEAVYGIGGVGAEAAIVVGFVADSVAERCSPAERPVCEIA